jgi:hypothetical protein
LIRKQSNTFLSADFSITSGCKRSLSGPFRQLFACSETDSSPIGWNLDLCLNFRQLQSVSTKLQATNFDPFVLHYIWSLVFRFCRRSVLFWVPALLSLLLFIWADCVIPFSFAGTAGSCKWPLACHFSLAFDFWILNPFTWLNCRLQDVKARSASIVTVIIILSPSSWSDSLHAGLFDSTNQHVSTVEQYLLLSELKPFSISFIPCIAAWGRRKCLISLRSLPLYTAQVWTHECLVWFLDKLESKYPLCDAYSKSNAVSSAKLLTWLPSRMLVLNQYSLLIACFICPNLILFPSVDLDNSSW